MNRLKKEINRCVLNGDFPYYTNSGDLTPDITVQNYVNCKLFMELCEHRWFEKPDKITIEIMRNRRFVAHVNKKIKELEKTIKDNKGIFHNHKDLPNILKSRESQKNNLILEYKKLLKLKSKYKKNENT